VESFHREVHNLLKSELEGLDPISILKVKSLIKAGLNDKNDFDAINLRESYGKT
jgi:peroxisomal 3,2-trans-enoyl-CoA isomerase